MLRIELPDSRSMREALDGLVQAAREERDWCDEHGRGTRADCYERIARAIEELLTAPASASATREEE